MQTTTFTLKGEFIALCDLLKTEGIVLVDGEVELRKTANIRAGQVLECLGQTIKVVAAEH